MRSTDTMPWGPPFPLDHDGTDFAASDRKVEVRHAAPPRRMALGAVLVGAAPLVVAVPVLLGWDLPLWAAMLAAAALMVAGLILAAVRTQIVVTRDSLFRWGGVGRPRPEVVETEDPSVEVWEEPREEGPVHVVAVHDRGEVFDVVESGDRERADEVAEKLRRVLGVDG